MKFVAALLLIATLAGCNAPKRVDTVRSLPFPSLGATDGVVSSP